jgi:hypothetical protein
MAGQGNGAILTAPVALWCWRKKGSCGVEKGIRVPGHQHIELRAEDAKNLLGVEEQREKCERESKERN